MILSTSYLQFIGPTSILDLLPKRTERAIFLGQTGSGKTTLARYLLSKRKYVVIYDGKGMIQWPGYKRVTTLKQLVRIDPVKSPKILYQPEINQLSKLQVDAFFKWIYIRRHTTCYVDEVYSCIQNGVPDYYLACITRGRERGIEVWNSVQRPSWIPLNIMTESENYYVFRLILKEDRRRVMELTGLEEGLTNALLKHEFYDVKLGESIEGPLKLNIKQ